MLSRQCLQSATSVISRKLLTHQNWHFNSCNFNFKEITMKLSTREISPEPDKPCFKSAHSDKLVVVVLGSTASGKSKLAIDLAKQVNGEIISADSMQVYDGLDILTNKSTEEEMKEVPHHMISVVNRTESFNVAQFRDMALPLVEDILARGKVPFIVGGTNYYIESILWKVLMEDRPSDFSKGKSRSSSESEQETSSLSPTKKAREEDGQNIKESDPTLSLLTFMKDRQGDFMESEIVSKWAAPDIFSALVQIDEPRASKLHPNDVRKVVRSLQVYFRTGKRHSELIEEQFAMNSSSDSEVDKVEDEHPITPTSLTGKLGGPLRFPNSICFWIQAEREILNKRIDLRVDQMVERGMKEELDDYIDHARKENWKWDFEEGQLQSIGVKEFRTYIKLPPEERSTEAGQKALEEGLERLKIVTRQYAKRQVQWVKQRFLKSSRRQLPRVYGLNGNEVDPSSWHANVTSPAIDILNAHLRNDLEVSIVKEKLLPVLTEDGLGKPQDFKARKCEICDKILLGSLQYEEHVRSSKHWKLVKRKKKLENLEQTKRKFASVEDSDENEVQVELKQDIH